jgi:hypothetical protein
MPTAPPGGFPQTPPIEAGVITGTIDDTLVTPYSHMVNFLVGRELRGGFAIEAGYVGRFGRDLLVRRDLAMPLNLVDTASGMDYFTAAQQHDHGDAGGRRRLDAGGPHGLLGEHVPGGGGGRRARTQLDAGDRAPLQLDGPDYITTLWLIDQLCIPACSKFGPYAFFAAVRLAGRAQLGRLQSDYHSMVVTLRKQYGQGVQFDLNYTLSESKDTGSSVERGGPFGNFSSGGYTGFLMNSWDTDAHYATSDFDVRHQVNFNFIWDLPFGQGRRYGTNASGFANQLIGDWSIAGLTRWTSGFPFNVYNCRLLLADQLEPPGQRLLQDPNRLPPTRKTKNAVDGRPSPFATRTRRSTYFRYSCLVKSACATQLRGDGYFTIDTSVSKAWRTSAISACASAGTSST